ncbi:MAG: hypothetical protein LBU98_02375 [Alistipes sp.]|jgi:hypothetical protein|nr:hypothetical protein [Alistipes sp.]
METKGLGSKSSQLMIREAIRKIALGRSIERVDMSPGGTGGVGTARMIHGYVTKIHDDPGDGEFAEYGGTIDVGEYPDETASASHIVHKGVLLAGAKDNAGGFLIIPTLFSDVTVVSDAATRYMYVVNFSHADVIQLQSHTEVTVGVTETEELDPESNDSPDYDKLEPTGNETKTTYTATTVDTVAKDDGGKEATVHIDPENINHLVDKSEINQSADRIEQKIGGMAVTVTEQKTTIGAEDASEPLVLGQQLAMLMREFITECTKIMTPTLMGTMPAVNAPNFAPLLSKIQKFLSQKAFTK